MNIKTGEIYRATFLDHGPDMPLRSARHFTGTEEVQLYLDLLFLQIYNDNIYSSRDSF